MSIKNLEKVLKIFKLDYYKRIVKKKFFLTQKIFHNHLLKITNKDLKVQEILKKNNMNY